MNRIIPALVLLVFISSCSMFFDADKRQDGSKGLKPLSLIGGGTLSDDTAQDQHPFLFRSKVKNYLFFSSDRAGSNDIYYAEMSADGDFYPPVLMDTNNINSSTSPEWSPVVFTYNGSNYITYLQQNSTDPYAYTCLLDANMNYVADVDYFMAVQGKNIGLIQDPTNPKLLVLYGTTVIEIRTFDGTKWNFSESITNEIPVDSANGFTKDGVDYYIASSRKDQFGVQQLLYGSSLTKGVLTPIPFYASEFDDFSPFIDTETYKVYFASTRYGKVNYDLYRYNYLTYDLLMDTGSHYVPPTGIIYVSKSGNDLNTGTSPTDALFTIGEAIVKAASLGYQQVYVTSGIYGPETGLNPSGSGIVITNCANIAIIGGWDSNFSYLSGNSILDGNNSFDHVVLFENCANISMEFFVIRNNVCAIASADNMGGGVFFKNAIACGLNYCIISNCAAVYGGGVAFSNSIASMFVGNTISSNTATNGAGIYIYDQFVGVSGLTVINNFAQGKGAAFYYNSAPQTAIDTCIISNNYAEGINSVIHFYTAGTNTYVNFMNNWIGATGAQSYAIYEEDNVINHTIVNNYFIGSGMSFLYRDYPYPSPEKIITNDTSWTNINDVSWTGASNAYGNIVTNY